MRRSSVVWSLGRCAALALLAAAVVVAPASAARLAGGREQTALSRAFFAHGAHKHQVIVSSRISTILPSWAVVKSVIPRPAGGTRARSPRPVLRTAFYHRVGSRERSGRPPALARADLNHRFTVQVQYSGSGSETIAYDQLYRGVCFGLGGFTDQQQDRVSPMSWAVRYEVDPDDLLSAVRGPQGTVLVPRVTFVRHGSSVTARQTLSRTAVDLTCAGKPTHYACTMTYQVSPGAGLVSFPAGEGIEVGVPMRSKGRGRCDPADYTLGPSLWDGGATTALVRSLGIVGGRLANDPYKPVSVAWPAGSAQATEGFVASPCTGDGTACTDAFTWHGVVALLPAGGS